MSWHFSQALVAAYSADCCVDSAPSVPSSTTPMHGTCWSPGKTMAACTPSRSGMTYAPSTGSHGEDVLMWCLADSRVRTSAPPERESESPENDPACGGKWLESSVRYCRDWSSWKTHQCLWEEALDWSSVTWPKWGMTRNGVLWERTTLEHLTSGTESGLWQTPVADDAVDRAAGKINSRGEPKLSAQVKIWPTPNSSDNRPRATEKSTARRRMLGKQISLEAEVKYPTPTASMMTMADMEQARYAGNKGGSRPSYQEAKWATPLASGWRSGKVSDATMEKNSRPLQEQVGGSLNPTWVEWLMGWPLGWSDCAASAMDRFQQWCDSHGISYLNESNH